MGFFMTSNDEQHNIVQQILQEYLEGDDLDSAVRLWDHQYRRQSLDKLSYFVFEIATTSTLRSLRKEILVDLERGLLQGIQATETTEPVQPAVVEQQPVTEAVKMTTPSVASTEGLSFFLQQLLSNLHNENPQDIYQLIGESLKEAKLPQYVGRDLIQWYQDRQHLASVTENADYIRKIVNILYSILCEYFGPMKADRLMSQAVILTEQQFPELLVKRFL